MIVRHVTDLTDTEHDVRTPNWRSTRVVLAAERVGFALHETRFYPGSANAFCPTDHVEAVFVVEGEGELLDEATGVVHQLRPGSLYLLDHHDRHQLRPTSLLRAICVLTPPAAGREGRDEGATAAPPAPADLDPTTTAPGG